MQSIISQNSRLVKRWLKSHILIPLLSQTFNETVLQRVKPLLSVILYTVSADSSTSSAISSCDDPRAGFFVIRLIKSSSLPQKVSPDKGIVFTFSFSPVVGDITASVKHVIHNALFMVQGVFHGGIKLTSADRMQGVYELPESIRSSEER